jgi:hypothetical protein
MYLVGTNVGRFSLFQWEPLWFSVWFSLWELKVFTLGDNFLENLLINSCSSENLFFENLKGYHLNLCAITFKGIKTYEHQFSVFSMCLVFRVDWPVIEHLKAQGRLDSSGGLCCFRCPNKTWTSSLGASNTLTIVENELKMKNLWPQKIKRVKNSNKTNYQTLQKLVLKH